MKVLLVEPAHGSRARGNTVTVDRWVSGLRAAGYVVRRVQPFSLARVAAEDRPDLIHAHHAVHTGQTALTVSQHFAIPLLVSIGGTDVHGPGDAVPMEARPVFAAANAIVGPYETGHDKIAHAIGDVPPFFIVRRGVAAAPLLPPRPRDGKIRALMAGAVRPVKGVHRAIDWAEAIGKRGIPLEVTIIGPPYDAAYSDDIRRRLAGVANVHWPGYREPEAMTAEFAAADFLWNFSYSEGAANAVLEAWAFGRPVLAHRAPGNTEVIEAAPGESGMLFDDDPNGQDLFVRRLEEEMALSDDAKNARGARIQEYVLAHHDAADEIRDLLRAYEITHSRAQSP